MSVDTEVATHQVALSFEDGVTRFITCRADQTVADASYRQRINIPLDCRDGACGTCKALCESGEYDAGTYIDDALPADEAERGYVLPCSMRPRSDLVLQVASTSEVAKTRAATYDARVTELTRLSTTTVELAVEIPEGADGAQARRYMAERFKVQISESYGRNIVRDWAVAHLNTLTDVPRVLDLGLGTGTDLLNIRSAYGKPLELFGLESYAPNIAEAQKNGRDY